jgi:hypothetical protein
MTEEAQTTAAEAAGTTQEVSLRVSLLEVSPYPTQGIPQYLTHRWTQYPTPY